MMRRRSKQTDMEDFREKTRRHDRKGKRRRR